MRLQVLFACVAFAAGAVSGAARATPASGEHTRHAAVDALFKAFTTNTPGAAVGIYHNGKLVYARGYGMADLEAGTPIGPQTRFHVASLSKQFTAFAIALLAREGKVDLEADIRRYLPFVPDFRAVITVRDLILHRSGLRDFYALFDIAGQGIHNVRHEQQVINLVSRQRALNFMPGTAYVYCNTDYTLLAEIVRAVTGRTLRQFTSERIFQPLGMTHTFFADDVSEIIPNRAQSYARTGDGRHWQRDLLNSDNTGATGLSATVGDLARWAANFSRPRVGDRALIEQISQNGTLRDGTPIRYGFGLQRTSLGGRDVVFHVGGEAGFQSIFAYFPGEDFAVAMTTNANFNLNLADEVTSIAGLYLLKTPAAPALVAVDARASPDRLVGTYRAPFAHSLRLEARNGRLYRNERDAPQELLQRVDGTFDAGSPQEEFFTAVEDASGGVVAVEQHSPGEGRVTRFERAPTVPLAPAFDELVGDYYSDELDITYRLRLENGRLLARSLWIAEPIVLAPVVVDRFESDNRYFAAVVFDRDGAGRIRGLHVSSDRARNIEMRRLAQ